MQDFLKPMGDSLAVVIPLEIREQWNLDATTQVEIRSDEHGILIIPVPDNTAGIEKAVKDADARYAETFRRLAE